MVLTENALKTYLEQRHIHITEQKKSEILEYLGKKPGEQEVWTRLSQKLCKPPIWCRIETPYWRF